MLIDLSPQIEQILEKIFYEQIYISIWVKSPADREYLKMPGYAQI